MPIDFLLDKPLLITWLPRLSFYGRCINVYLEFMITVPLFCVVRQNSLMKRLYLVEVFVLLTRAVLRRQSSPSLRGGVLEKANPVQVDRARQASRQASSVTTSA